MEEDPATGNNGKQGKCLGTKPGALQMTDRMRREFLDKWHKRSLISWTELVNHHRHGLGSELIPKNKIKAQIPRQFQELTKFRVFRHQENLPFVGWKDGGIFYLLWIETKYGDLCSH
ncbi:hypothetical protein QP918_10795 [Corynebacterium accolens]|uniref:hypothetical protein n=1 Tax=Corynebacterium accolens TaxID=38284 RepID=UPI002550C212|nr:hypothetical protein [Corynebacterium accolens]MDK8675928.1 hypothetical protein [Corynebacterium accolens]